ncbi:DNA cytosine methyltransferase [Neorhizobium petrolearium]|uniref:DNA cytosine methyltransferase n=1 Tax=Neorhizobium petrolearium TaxID=515361 RepID=UPI003F8031AD
MNFIDLFAGCGGLSWGLSAAGLRPRFAIEAHADAFATYSANLIDHNWPDWLPQTPHDITSFLANYGDKLDALRGQVDLVAGGPPCQGFSMNGRRNPSDPRNKMVSSYLEVIERVSPTLVLLENVRGFTSMQHEEGGMFSDYVARKLRTLGYDVWTRLIHAAEWGVPQRRPRFFLVAVRNGLLKGIDPFDRMRVARREFLLSRGLSLEGTPAKDALVDLETADRVLVDDAEFGHRGFKSIRYESVVKLPPFASLMRRQAKGQPTDLRLPIHSKEVTRRFAEILATCLKGRCLSPEDRQRLSIKKRSTTPIHPDQPSPTVTTLPDDMIHYSEPRVLTVREHARLQSFPDTFRFTGPYTSGGARRKSACPRYTQVGNAVPPLLAEALGEMLMSLGASISFEERTNSLNIADVRSKRFA